MAEEYSSVRITRGAAKKRAAAADQILDLNMKKKRVVLGELPNLNNVLRSYRSDTGGEFQKPINKLKKKEKEVEDIGGDANSDDPQICAAYASEIYEYLHSMEIQTRRRPIHDYIEKIQKEVTMNMRGVLVDWLVEVGEEYKLKSDTLYLTISYIDRFLSLNPVNRQKLQLLGVSSMFIASKYEEITPPDIEDFCYITDHTYSKQDIVKMERDILKYLNFEMGDPTIKTFLRRFTMAAQENSEFLDLELEFLGCYLAELSLLDYYCVRFLPSMVAASVIFLSKFTIQPKIHPWNSTLEKYSGYKSSDLKDCVLAIHEIQLSKKLGSLVAVRDKYKQERFKRVANLKSPSQIPQAYFEEL